MGASFGWPSRAALLAHFRDPGFLSPGYNQIKSAIVGANYWYVFSMPGGRKGIGLNLILRSQGEYGYKGLDESMGPCEVNCPLSLLALADSPAPAFVHAIEWRRKVREYHEARAARPALVSGLVLTYGGQDYRLYAPADEKRRGWYVHAVSTGALYRMAPRLLNQSKVHAA